MSETRNEALHPRSNVSRQERLWCRSFFLPSVVFCRAELCGAAELLFSIFSVHASLNSQNAICFIDIYQATLVLSCSDHVKSQFSEFVKFKVFYRYLHQT